ncbi:MAG: YceI family protein [Arenimonas sp.]
MKTAIKLLLACAAMAAAGVVDAAAWRVLPGSSLGFTATYQDEAFEGRFARFSPVIVFDPKQLATASFDVSIQLASADTRNGERDEMLQGSEFFNSGKQPQARYSSRKFRALGGNRYVADGTLSLNGVSKPVPLNFTWSGGDRPVLVGSATLKRLDFGIGTGDWTDTGLLPNEVRVTTRLLLAAPARTPAGK